MEKKEGIYFNTILNKNVVDFDLCNYRIDQVVLSLNNNTYLNAPTDITSDVIFTVLPVNDSKDLIQKLELSGDQNCYYLRSYDGVNKVWNGWQTPQGQGGGTGGVSKVSSANSDIDVANQTTTPVLTLNSTVDGAASKIVKLKDDGSMGAIDVGSNTLVTNPKTTQKSTLNQALVDAYSIPNITIANTVFVGKNGTAQGTGAINNLYATIQAAIDASPANTQIFVYASGLSGASNVYAENLTLKAGQIISGASSQFVVIAGTVTTPANGGTCYLENLRIQTPSTAGNVSSLNFAGGANVTNLQLSNVDINIYGGTGSVINYTNTNSNSKLVSDGTSAWNVLVSKNGAKLFTSSATSAGTVIIQNVSAQINDNTNNVAYSINGAVKFYHTLDNIYGQIVVSNTAAFFGTFLTIYTNNVSALITNSPTISTLNSVVMTTTANALAGTNVVEGAGAFVYYQTSTPYTTVKGFASTLNAGIGAIAAATYSIRLDSSGIAPFTAGTSDGTIQYDGSNYYVDTATQRYKLVTADFTTSKLLASWLNYNQNPTFANKTTTDVMSSSSFWSAVAQIAGNNLTYNATTGKLDAVTTTDVCSALYMNNWGADQPVTNGFINLTGANAVAVGSDISYNGTGTDIALVAGKNYDFTVAINSRQNGVPSASLNTMGYSDSTFTTDNIAVTNGSITNNVYTCTGTTGTAQFVQAYDTQGVMNAFTPRAVVYPTQMAISPVSTATSLFTYTQLATTGVQPTIVKNGAISSQALTRNISTGGVTGDNNTAFDHPFNGSNPVEYAACASHGDVSVISDSLNATRFAFSKTAGISYTSQTTPLANTVTLESSLTACYARDIGVAVFVGTSGISCRIDVNAGTFTQVNISQQGAKQVVRGNLGGTMNFIAVGNSNTWNQFIKSTDGSSWLTIAANNLPSILPTTGTVTPVYSMGGICQTKDSLKAWIVAVNDTANNITYLCSSSDLVSFSSLASTASEMLANANTTELLELKEKLPTNLNATIQSYSGFNVNGLFCELVSGVGLAAGASSIIMYSSNTSGANNKVVYNNVFWASPSYWVTLNNPASIGGTQRGFMYPSGVFGLWATGGTANLISTCDGGLTWVTRTNLTSFTYMMPLGDYQLCSCSTVSASRKYSATYRNNYVTTMLYSAVWAGGQKLQAGTSVNPIVTLTDQTVATYSYSDSGAMSLIGALLTPNQTHEFFSVGVTGINKAEKVSLLNGTGYVIQNTFLWTMVGTNCTVTTTTQAPGVQGNIQTSIQGLITNVQANATVRLKCDYNNGTNTLGGANSIKITKL